MKKVKQDYRREYLHDDVEGKICIDIAERTSDNTTNNREKVIICLHGVSGTS